MSPGKNISLQRYRPVVIDGLVRVGRDNDGGYVLPASVITRSRVLLSLGVNDDWSFEAGVLARNPSIRLTCVDGSTGFGRVAVKALQKSVDMIGYLFSMQWKKLVRNARYLPTPFRFRRFFSEHELLPLMVGGPGGEGGSVALAALVERVTTGAPDEWILLKIDIEGSEYEILPADESLLSRVSALLIEFHDLESHWNQFVRCMDDLTRNFYVAHVHGNNFQGYIPGTTVPYAVEVTLINKALVPGNPASSANEYPLPGLDMPNNWQRADLPLIF